MEVKETENMNEKLISDNQGILAILNTDCMKLKPEKYLQELEKFKNILPKTDRYLSKKEILKIFNDIKTLSNTKNMSFLEIENITEDEQKIINSCDNNNNKIIQHINDKLHEYKQKKNFDVKNCNYICALMTLIYNFMLANIPDDSDIIKWEYLKINKKEIDILAKFIIFLLSNNELHNVNCNDLKTVLINIATIYRDDDPNTPPIATTTPTAIPTIPTAIPTIPTAIPTAIPTIPTAPAQIILAPIIASVPKTDAELMQLSNEMKQDNMKIEKQAGELSCGRNAINNFLRKIFYVRDGGDEFDIQKFKANSSIPQTRINLLKLSHYLHKNASAYYAAEIGENYDSSTLGFALGIAGVDTELISFREHQTYLSKLDNSLNDTEGLLINKGWQPSKLNKKDKVQINGLNHWVSVKKINNKYYYYDSLKDAAQKFDTGGGIYKYFNDSIGFDKILQLHKLKETNKVILPSAEIFNSSLSPE